jgi:Mn2+/Fe2+ NRAMP family transporter
LSPLLGDHAKILIAVGLFSAGITSAITAPLAAAFVLSGLNGWNLKQKDNKFRATWLTIIILGIIISTTGIQPILLIKYAQLCNGILLPLIAGLLLWMANRRKLMTHYRNKNWQNILGFTVLLVTIGLGIRLIISVLGING